MMWLVNLLGLLLIAAIVWWFWLYKPSSAARPDNGIIQIRVAEGVYSPSVLEVPVNETTLLRFYREDPAPCAESVAFDGLDVQAELPLEATKDVAVKPEAPGQYPFHCQMHMYKGTLRAQSR